MPCWSRGSWKWGRHERQSEGNLRVGGALRGLSGGLVHIVLENLQGAEDVGLGGLQGKAVENCGIVWASSREVQRLHPQVHC